MTFGVACHYKKNYPIENMFCRHLLGVHKSTTAGVLLELGRIPLHVFAKNWERIRSINVTLCCQHHIIAL